MIVFDLACNANDHRFEGWFGSSDDFADQQARGLVACPVCDNTDVIKVVSAPNIGRKSNQRGEKSSNDVSAPAAHTNAPFPPEAVAALKAIAKLQAEALKTSTWVGKRFADSARAMHYGETEAAPIHGQTTPQEAQALHEEGVAIAPILFPIAPPEDLN